MFGEWSHDGALGLKRCAIAGATVTQAVANIIVRDGGFTFVSIQSQALGGGVLADEGHL